MNTVLVILGYFKWHYGKALRSLSSIWNNFLTFIFDFFSINLLLKDFFAPWKRMSDPYPKIIELREFFYTLIINSITRIIGIIMRTLFLIIGLTCYVIFALLYPVAIIIWLTLPIIVVLVIISGLHLIIK